MSAFAAVLKRDLVLALRRKNEVITSVFFFVVVAALFPLGIGPEMNTLRLVGFRWAGCLPPITPTAAWSKWPYRLTVYLCW